MKISTIRKMIVASIAAFSLSALSGCTIYDLFSSTSSTSKATTSTNLPSISIPQPGDYEGYYQARSVNDKFSFQVAGAWNEDPYCPTKGDVHILVVPVEFSDYPFAQSTLDDIRVLTSGTPKETNYWESLASFYQKSSYGQLNFSFTIMDKVNVGSTSSFANKSTDDYYLAPTYAMSQAIEEFKSKNGDNSTRQFDSDQDGYIDAVIMIYSSPDYTKDEALKKYDTLFWAYCYADYRDPRPKPSVNSPVGYRFFWASYDFFYTGTGTPKNHTGVDAHTLIHETGHLFGSDDYYNVIQSRTDNDEPSGGLMMMGWNVGDHDMFSKLCYGWVKPFIPTESCQITLRPSESSGDCILLADSWNGTAFDEYIIIDYVTPTGLNKLDAETVYPEYKGKIDETFFREPGIRVFHVDARFAYGIGYVDQKYFSATDFLTDEEIMTFDKNTFDKRVRYKGQEYYATLAPAISNSKGIDSSIVQGKGYELIQMIQRSGLFTLTDGDTATSSDLFKKGDTFTMKKYSRFFQNQTGSLLNSTGLFNNGAKLPFSFTVEDMGSNGAIISIEKI